MKTSTLSRKLSFFQCLSTRYVLITDDKHFLSLNMNRSAFSIMLFTNAHNLHAQSTSQNLKEQIDKTSIETGILLNAGLSNEVIDRLNSLDISSELIDEESYRIVYTGLKDADLNDKFARKQIININKRDRPYETRIPLSLINVTGDYPTVKQLKENIANKERDILTKNVKYRKVNIKLISSLQQDIYQGSGVFYLDLKNSIFESNDPFQKFEIDLLNGDGYKNYPYKDGQEIPFKFTAIGTTFVKVRLSTAQKEFIFNIAFNIVSTELPEFDMTFDLEVPSVITDEKARSSNAFTGGTASVQLGCDRVFNKPVIVIEGFDPVNSNTITGYLQPKYNVRFSQMQNAGYDIVYLSFSDATTWIQNNSSVLKQLINKINSSKVGNEKIIVIGESMGGLVARHALRSMEQNNQIHNVSHYISFDSPHKGANIPVGAQMLFEDAGNTSVGQLAQLFSKEVRDFIAAFNSPAAQQMLIRYKGPNPHPNFTNFQNELNQMGFPLQTNRNVTIINGSLNGTLQRDGNNITEVPGQFMGRTTRYFGVIYWDINGTTNHINLETKVSELTINLNKKERKYTIPLNYDITPGGSYFAGAQSGFLNLNVNFSLSFVPTFSAVDYKGSLANQNSHYINAANALKSNGLGSFDTVYGDNFNDLHVDVQTEEDAWDDLIQIEFGVGNSVPACATSNQAPNPYFNGTYCFPNGGQYTFALSETPLPGTTSVSWVVQPGNITWGGDNFTLYSWQLSGPPPYTITCTTSFLGNPYTTSYTGTIYGYCQNSNAARISFEERTDEIQAESVLVYPNPASEMLRVNLPDVFRNKENSSIITAEIIDVNGRSYLQKKISGETTDIDIRNLQEGRYILRISNNLYSVSKNIQITN